MSLLTKKSPPPLTAEEEARLVVLLEEEHRFPGEFTFKAICQSPLAASRVAGCVSADTGLQVIGTPTQRDSSGGTYSAVTFMLLTHSAHDVLRVYACLRTVEGVMSFF